MESEAVKILTKLFPSSMVVKISDGCSAKKVKNFALLPPSSMSCFTLLAGILISAASDPEKNAERKRPRKNKINSNKLTASDGGSMSGLLENKPEFKNSLYNNIPH